MERESSAPGEESMNYEALGLRPVTRWVPDTRDPEFLKRYRDQWAVLAASAANAEEIAWWERTQSHDGWV
jgi:hypothetical protein